MANFVIKLTKNESVYAVAQLGSVLWPYALRNACRVAPTAAAPTSPYPTHPLSSSSSSLVLPPPLSTPSPFPWVSAGLPILLASVVVFPHPITLYAYIVARIAENTINHSGVDNWFVDAVFMKFLPFRAKVAHHDYHHKFSNHASNAKNFGENWTLWDDLFGTVSHLRPSTPSSRSRSAAKAQSE